MRRIEVNFVEASRPPMLLWAAALVLCLVAVAALCFAWSEQRELNRLRTTVAVSSSSSQQAPVPAQEVVLPPLYEASARRMLAERSVDWPRGLSALEQVRVDGVQIVGFEVSAAQQRIRVEVRFTELKRLLEYVRELNQGEPQARWEIEHTSQGRDGEGAKAAIFGRLEAAPGR